MCSLGTQTLKKHQILRDWQEGEQVCEVEQKRKRRQIFSANCEPIIQGKLLPLLLHTFFGDENDEHGEVEELTYTRIRTIECFTTTSNDHYY